VLRSFRKVFLEPGDRTTVTFDALHPVPDLAIWDVAAHDWAPVHGRFAVMVGASSRDIRLTGYLNN